MRPEYCSLEKSTKLLSYNRATMEELEFGEEELDIPEGIKP